MSKIRIILIWITVVFLSSILCVTFAFAKGKGKGNGSSSPQGWSQGEKKGWETGAPPGFDKKSEGAESSGLRDQKRLHKGDDDAGKLQEKEQDKDRKKERHGERHQEGKSKEK